MELQEIVTNLTRAEQEKRRQALEAKMHEPSFWNSPEREQVTREWYGSLIPILAENGQIDLIPVLRCRRCKRIYPKEVYVRRRKGGTYINRSCPNCVKPCNAAAKLRNAVNSASWRARKLGRITTLTLDDWIAVLEASKGACHYCHVIVGVDELTMDHVVPLLTGGTNCKENIVAACAGCNKSKGYFHYLLS